MSENEGRPSSHVVQSRAATAATPARARAPDEANLVAELAGLVVAAGLEVVALEDVAEVPVEEEVGLEVGVLLGVEEGAADEEVGTLPVLLTALPLEADEPVAEEVG